AECALVERIGAGRRRVPRRAFRGTWRARDRHSAARGAAADLPHARRRTLHARTRGEAGGAATACLRTRGQGAAALCLVLLGGPARRALPRGVVSLSARCRGAVILVLGLRGAHASR